MSLKWQALLVSALVVFGTAAFAENRVVFRGPQVRAMSAGTYWTPERMANSKPLDLVLQNGPVTSTNGSAIDATEETGTPGVFTSSAIGAAPVLMESRSAAPLLTVAEPSASGFDYPPPHITYPLVNSWYKTFPYRTVGRVFFSDLAGNDYSCSGSAIGNRVVLTAGHCVSNGQGTFYTNHIFIPASRGSVSPYGIWDISDTATLDEWHLDKNYCNDIGALITVDKDGKTLAQTVGNLGFAYNQPVIQQFSMHGYPGEYPYNGLRHIQTNAAFASSDGYIGCSPKPVAIGSPQTRGTSGGPRIVKFRPGSSSRHYNLANGVNSYFYISEPKQIYSPYFGDQAKALYDAVIGR